MKSKLLLALFFLAFAKSLPQTPSPSATTSVDIKTYDGLKVNNIITFVPPATKPFVVFLHQSNWNLHEYDEISKRFLELGYNSAAIDLRYGREMNGVPNLTYLEAVNRKKNTDYVSSMEDIRSTVEAVKKRYAKGDVILFGSSISASLALLFASKNKRIAAVIAFSPGEYFPGNNALKKEIDLKIPIFIAGSKEERQSLIPIFMSAQSTFKVLFTPKDKHGQHGAKALWESNDAHEEYWKSLENFLDNVYSHKKL